MPSELIMLALEFYRSPPHLMHLADPKIPLPPSIYPLFSDFGAALAPGRIKDTAAKLDTTEQEIAKAALFLIRHVLLAPGSDHYRTLGLVRSAPAETVTHHYRILAALLHPDRHPELEDEGTQSLLVRVNLAYETLRNREARQSYDRTLATLSHKPRRARSKSSALVGTRSRWDWTQGRQGSARRAWIARGLALVLALIAVGLIVFGMILDSAARQPPPPRLLLPMHRSAPQPIPGASAGDSPRSTSNPRGQNVSLPPADAWSSPDGTVIPEPLGRESPRLDEAYHPQIYPRSRL